jgi:hypothetical protein
MEHAWGSEVRTPFSESPRSKYGVDVKVNLKDIMWDDVVWINLAQDGTSGGFIRR